MAFVGKVEIKKLKRSLYFCLRVRSWEKLTDSEWALMLLLYRDSDIQRTIKRWGKDQKIERIKRKYESETGEKWMYIDKELAKNAKRKNGREGSINK